MTARDQRPRLVRRERVDMRIVMIAGHPDAGSYGDALARSYVEGAE
jgi:hypothetical protein